MTHIQMHDDYTETTRYTGMLDDKHPFTVSCDYDSITKHYEIREILWTGSYAVKNIEMAEKKIRDFVTKWLFDKPKKETDNDD